MLTVNIHEAKTHLSRFFYQAVAVWFLDAGKEIFFSAASIWELAVKCSLNRTAFVFFPEDIHQFALR